MDLLCCESETVKHAYLDPVLDDSRVFYNMMVSEEKYTISCCYFKCLQKTLKPYMRRVVADWMQEVCEEEHCQEQVFFLAVNILDRFLSLVHVEKGQLQLIGAVCLFLASKLKQRKPLSVERLRLYTDYSISASELLNWELMVLIRLKWDIAAVTPHDFVRHILWRLHVQGHDHELVLRHVNTFIGLCATDPKFSMYPPSMIAAACIGAAIQGLMPKLDSQQWLSLNELLTRLHEITAIDVDCLRSCLEQIEETIVIATKQVSELVPLEVLTSQKLGEQQINPLDMEVIVQAETPTDVQDVLF